MLGFANLGDVNSHLDRFEQSVETNTISESPLAKAMLVIMVRGLFTKLQFPYAQFPSVKLSGDQIFDPFWEAVYRIERCGLKVVGATFDGASPNRRFVKLHGITQPTNTTVLHKVLNPYADGSRMLFFFSDPPHLLKTTRITAGLQTQDYSGYVCLNILVSSYIIITCPLLPIEQWQADCLEAPGRSVSWRCHGGAQRDQPGLSLVPKLKYEHIHLTSFSRMRVDLAAQVITMLHGVCMCSDS